MDTRFALSDRAFYIPRIKFIAKTDPFTSGGCPSINCGMST